MLLLYVRSTQKLLANLFTTSFARQGVEDVEEGKKWVWQQEQHEK